MKPCLQKKAEGSDPRAMFYAGVQCYWNNDRRRAFELLSQAMEIGLPKDREYCSDGHSEINAALFLVPMLINDDDGCLSQNTEPFWFEKQSGPVGEPRKTAVIRANIRYDELAVQRRASEYLREIFLYVTGRGGAPRDLKKAAYIAQSIVLELSFGDRDHDPAIALRSILQDAAAGRRIKNAAKEYPIV